MDALERKVELLSSENSEFRKKISNLEDTNCSLVGQLHKLQAIIARTQVSLYSRSQISISVPLTYFILSGLRIGQFRRFPMPFIPLKYALSLFLEQLFKVVISWCFKTSLTKSKELKKCQSHGNYCKIKFVFLSRIEGNNCAIRGVVGSAIETRVFESKLYITSIQFFRRRPLFHCARQSKEYERNLVQDECG